MQADTLMNEKASASFEVPLMSRADMGNFPTGKYDTAANEKTKKLSHRGVSVKIGINVNNEQTDRIKSIIDANWGIFSKPTGRIGNAVGIEYKVLFDHDARPVCHQQMRVSGLRRDITRKQVEEYLSQGVLEPSNSPNASRVVIAGRGMAITGCA